jgi:hypothetical protein
MTDPACVKWMQEKDYFKRWLTPRAGLNDRIERNDGKISKDYGLRPPGNLPEVVCQDSSCNVDIDLCVHDHMHATKHEPDEDKQFSRATVKRQDSAFLRVLHPTDAEGQPLPGCKGGPAHLRKRYWKDHQECFSSSLFTVWEADGAAVQGVGEKKKIRYGRRFVPTGGKGGPRAQHAEFHEPEWLHPDARPAKAAKLERSVKRARGKQ